MPSLLTTTEIDCATGALGDHFDTFSRDIVIYKEPKKIVADTNGNTIYGYGDSSSESNVSYSYISGVYKAIRVNTAQQNPSPLSEIKKSFPDNYIQIKVKEDARAFIKAGKTERIEIDGLSYNLAGGEKSQYFLGLVFYYFDLTRTI